VLARLVACLDILAEEVEIHLEIDRSLLPMPESFS
jgi:hypothetical protein